MSSNTTNTTEAGAATTAAVPNPFTTLTVDELTQLQATLTPTLTALQTGDGSAPSLIGQWVALQGALVSNLSLFQKIGVNDGAAWIASLINNGINDLKTKATAA